MKKFAILFLALLVSLCAYAEDMRFIQVSDVRFSTNSGVNDMTTLINDINKQKNVEFVVFTGDNINKPDKNSLEQFVKEAKKLNCPFYILTGEHDVNKHKDLSKVDYYQTIKKQIRKYKQTEPNYIFEKKGIVFILLDGSKDVIPGTNGFYKDNTVQWLDEQLTVNNDKKVFIFQHFPIIPPVDKENYSTFKPEKYLSVLNSHKNVQAIIAGHFGINDEKYINGINHICTSGLPYYRIIDVLDCDTAMPTIWTTLKEIK